MTHVSNRGVFTTNSPPTTVVSVPDNQQDSLFLCTMPDGTQMYLSQNQIDRLAASSIAPEPSSDGQALVKTTSSRHSPAAHPYAKAAKRRAKHHLRGDRVVNDLVAYIAGIKYPFAPTIMLNGEKDSTNVLCLRDIKDYDSPQWMMGTKGTKMMTLRKVLNKILTVMDIALLRDDQDPLECVYLPFPSPDKPTSLAEARKMIDNAQSAKDNIAKVAADALCLLASENSSEVIKSAAAFMASSHTNGNQDAFAIIHHLHQVTGNILYEFGRPGTESTDAKPK